MSGVQVIIKNFEKFNFKIYVLLGVTTTCGALTHYYFLVYVFFVSIVFIVLMISQKRIKETIAYCITMCVGGVVSYMIFPPMIDHIFKQGRGAESIRNIKTSNISERIDSYMDLLDKGLFGGFIRFISIMVILMILIDLINSENGKEKVACHFEKLQIDRYVCLLLPSLFYVLLVSKSAPYIANRYVAPIYAVVVAGVYGIAYTCFMNVYGEKEIRNKLFLGFAVIVVLLSLLNCKWDNLFLDSTKRLNNAREYGEKSEAIVLYDRAWHIYPYYLELCNCSNSIFFNVDSYSQFKESINIDSLSDDIAFFLIGMDSDGFIEEFLLDNKEYSVVVDNGIRSYGHSYYLRK
ncbi:MAG: hypothetical protein K6G24_13825 [Lachnospiraceae bacterium]|nr:hypothetical protein [Lachnospiraceae bacterium]